MVKKINYGKRRLSNLGLFNEKVDNRIGKMINYVIKKY